MKKLKIVLVIILIIAAVVVISRRTTVYYKDTERKEIERRLENYKDSPPASWSMPDSIKKK